MFTRGVKKPSYRIRQQKSFKLPTSKTKLNFSLFITQKRLRLIKN